MKAFYATFFVFFIVTSNFYNLMYPRRFLCEETKIKHDTSSKKEHCETDDEAVWESGFTCFLYLFLYSISFYFNLFIVSTGNCDVCLSSPEQCGCTIKTDRLTLTMRKIKFSTPSTISINCYGLYN